MKKKDIGFSIKQKNVFMFSWITLRFLYRQRFFGVLTFKWDKYNKVRNFKIMWKYRFSNISRGPTFFYTVLNKSYVQEAVVVWTERKWTLLYQSQTISYLNHKLYYQSQTTLYLNHNLYYQLQTILYLNHKL